MRPLSASPVTLFTGACAPHGLLFGYAAATALASRAFDGRQAFRLPVTRMNQIAFVCLAFAGTLYFIIQRRTFDPLTVAFGGMVFYFVPLAVGSLPVLSEWGHKPGAVSDIVPGTYGVGFAIIATVVATALLVDLTRFEAVPAERIRGPSLSSYYLAISVAGFIGALYAAGPEKLFNIDKTIVIENSGYGYVLFETSAALLCIDAVLNRRWGYLVCGIALLAVNIFMAYRYMTLMTALSVALVMLNRQGAIIALRKVPTYGAAAVVLFVILTSVNTARVIVLLPSSPKPIEVANERSQPKADVEHSASATLSPAKNARTEPPAQNSVSAAADAAITRVVRLGALADPDFFLKNLAHIEPFTTISILNEILRHNTTCSMDQAWKLILLLPVGRLGQGYFDSFESEWKADLFPDVRYGLAGNIWAEMICRYGYGGFLISLLIFGASLAGLGWMLARVPLTYVPPIALASVLLGFYIHRNELYYELLLLRRCVILLVTAATLWAAFNFQQVRECRRFSKTFNNSPYG